MKPWITNVSNDDLKNGNHPKAGANAMLIQIADPPGNYCEPKDQFAIVARFQFLDLEQHDHADDEEMRIQQWQANAIAELLQRALFEGRNVIVQCYVGVARSGAVVDVGVQLGFDDTGTYRNPNRLVRARIMQALGW